MSVRKLTELSLLTSIALIIFIIELRMPNLSPVPGVKLGLANIITVYCVYHFSPKETAMLVISRTLLGAFFAGNLSTLIYSMSGAAFCLLGMLAIRKMIPEKYIWLCSIAGAVFHNTGQIFAAVIIMRTSAVLTYYPILIFSGCIAGTFTGLCAQIILNRVDTNSQKNSRQIRRL